MRLWLLVLTFLALTLSRPAMADGDPHAVDAASGLPLDMDVLVVVEDLAALRQTEEGRALAGLLEAAGVLGTVGESWAMLSRELGLSPAETMDRLLGRRIVLAMRDGAGGATDKRRARWTLLSEINRPTANLLRKRLAVAPRTVVGGQQVLAVEGGNLDLTLHTHKDGRVTLLLGPSDAPDVFGDLVASVVKPLARGEAMGRSPVLDESRRLGAADVVVLARVDAPAGQAREDAPPWDNFVVFNFRREAGAFAARIVVRDRAMWKRFGAVDISTDAPVRLAGDALLAMVNVGMTNGGAAEAMALLPAGVREGFELSEEVRGGLGPRRAVLAWEDEEGKRLGVVVGLQVRDQAIVPDLDRTVAAWIGAIERRMGSNAPAPAMSAGVPPEAVRVEPVRLPEGNPLGVALGGDVVAAWTYRRRAGLKGASWCAVGLGAGCEAAPRLAERGAEVLAGAAAGAQRKRWLSVGLARPAALFEAARAALPIPAGLAAMARRIEHVEWRLELTDLQDVEGEATVRLIDVGR